VTVVATLAAALVLAGAACSRSEDERTEETATTVTTTEPVGTTAPATEPTVPADTTTTQPPAGPEPPPPSDPPTPSWSQPTEEEYAALRAAYADGFRRTCEEIFGLSPSGRMEDPEDPGVYYTLDDCLFEMDDTMGEVNDTTEQAYQSGVDDALSTAESFTFSGTLCSETGRCWEY
jgi:type IV secretory pathway VirB10-like protein